MGKYIGIDLGTTYSVAAIINKDGTPQVINNQEGENTTPSAVLFDDGAVVVGSEAKNVSVMNPENYVAFAKRKMGSKLQRYSINNEKYSPEEISAMILKKIKNDTEKALGDEILGAVITVPAYFTDAQRKSTQDAAVMAKIPVLGIINEPTAAALAYGITKGEDKEKKILVYDLGGGTFDVSIMQFTKDTIEILASCGDSELGGWDFDQQIIKWFENIAKIQGADIKADVMARQTLMIEAEKAKKSLSSGKAKIRFAIPVMGKPIKAELSKEEFENMIEPYIQQSISVMDAAVMEANIEYEELDKILLVGGSTRIPLVREMIKEETEIEPSSDIHPDEAVAIGAAYYAVECVKNQGKENSQASFESESANNEAVPIIDTGEIPEVESNYTFTDRTSHGIGVKVYDEELGTYFNSIILPKNSVVPAQGERDFVTVADYQEVLLLEVLQGETSDLKYTTTIGETELRLRPKPKGTPIRVIISCDNSSIIHVHVVDLQDNEDLGEMKIDRISNLSDEEVKAAQNKLGKLNIGWED